MLYTSVHFRLPARPRCLHVNTTFYKHACGYKFHASFKKEISTFSFYESVTSSSSWIFFLQPIKWARGHVPSIFCMCISQHLFLFSVVLCSCPCPQFLFFLSLTPLTLLLLATVPPFSSPVFLSSLFLASLHLTSVILFCLHSSSLFHLPPALNPNKPNQTIFLLFLLPLFSIPLPLFPLSPPPLHYLCNFLNPYV